MGLQIFMGHYSSMVGAATFVIIFFGSNIVKHLGWRFGALTTPVLMGGLAAPFFAYVITQVNPKPSTPTRNPQTLSSKPTISHRAGEP